MLLLRRDPNKRPSAREALHHPWLEGAIEERGTGAPLGAGVVQRLQRFGTSSVFKRSVFDHIAAELLLHRSPSGEVSLAFGCQHMATESTAHA